ncbi:MAG: acetyl-CoA carboxylase biotin carboxylase subunit [Defluviitaleaceae bacterium]|nr:acetyl-CoA carboxylase biotin carboxylase subunit [Defluviitaleaceae bacterium]
MFKKILIANRGEIAVRIIRACKEMGIETVAIYSTGDKEALHVQLADEAICVGPAAAVKSYLNMENVISAAVLTKSEAIHPGFGFLSENPKFARLVTECGMVFIGPDADVIEEMGNKSRARQVTIAAGVPVVPGSEGNLTTAEEAVEVAKTIGYPVLIKATNGGGGKGMRVVEHEADFINLFNIAKSEAKANFGDDSVYLEKYVVNPKHIEFQLMGDAHGNYVHLFERDCSIQRNHQKMIEEAPCRGLSDKTRDAMAADVIKLARATKYNNAGTLEFIVDKDENYYFIEMNTRIQVEHPVTEMITGIDLIKEQIKVAAGAKLSFTQADVKVNGYAIECRINAEDPMNGFMPSVGRIENLILPGGFGVRVDTMIYPNYTISPFYDSMILKLIVHGKNRLEAIKKMRRAIEELFIDGITTNNEFHYYMMHHVDYVKGDFDTSFVGKFLEELAEGKK